MAYGMVLLSVALRNPSNSNTSKNVAYID